MTKINKYKLFEYAYNELREEEMIEIEEAISKDPEALKIVNEYLLLKQNFPALPIPVVTSSAINSMSFLVAIFFSSCKKSIDEGM